MHCVRSQKQAAMTQIKNEWSHTSTPFICLFWRGQDNDWFKAMTVALSSVNNDAVIIIVI
jgi:hypothetical protein